MTEAANDWGDMVAPGVYMIQRAPPNKLVSEIMKKDGTVDLQLIHLEIEEMEKHITALRKSNIEIAAYLREKREHGPEDEEGGGMTTMVAMTSGGTEDEDEDAVFREALEENILVIARKENELGMLRELIKSQRCGCGSAHAHEHATAETASPASATRISL